MADDQPGNGALSVSSSASPAWQPPRSPHRWRHRNWSRPKSTRPQSQQNALPKPATARPANPKPAGPAQPRAAQAAQPRPAPGPMLAIPGVTAPTARPRATVRPQSVSPPQTGISPFSDLMDAPPARSTAPITRPLSPSNGMPPIDAVPGPSPHERIPLTIEPLIELPSPESNPTGSPALHRSPGALSVRG